MLGTYKSEDVIVLLKDITGMVETLPTAEREKNIQSGTHYSEMLPIEYEPTPEYMRIYRDALVRYSGITAKAVARVAEKIMEDKGGEAVLVSLARAGTPIGILIKRYIAQRYGIDTAHYTISIIRDRGIDKNAMDYILKRHRPEKIQFVDGWTGKGAIQRELNKAMLEYKAVSPGLAVLSDPAYIAEKCGTHEDFLIASSCLNATVSGLLSRTFLRSDIIGKEDYHGALFYKELADRDETYRFIESVESSFPRGAFDDGREDKAEKPVISDVEAICAEYGIDDINLVKPGIGETTRVLLRRLPWRVLVHSLNDEEHLGHIYRLAKEKGAEIKEYPLKNYRACGIIRKISDA